MAVTAGQEARGGLALATPGDWFAIRLPRERADAGRLMGDVLAARPDLAAHRDAVRDLLVGLIKAAEALAVIAAYATVLDVVGGPLVATLVVNVLPMGEHALDDIAAELGAQRGEGLPPTVTGMFDLPAGRTARIERLAESPDGDSARRPVSFIAQYVTEAPLGQVAILTFSTPAVALADQLRQLFHQIACTLRFESPTAES